MIFSLHIIVALASIVAATYTFFRPSTAKLYSVYGLIAATFLTGTYLVVVAPSLLLHTCIAGIAYLVVVGFVAVAARNKLVAMNSL